MNKGSRGRCDKAKPLLQAILFLLMATGVGYFSLSDRLQSALVVMLAITIMLTFVSLSEISQFTATFLGSSINIRTLQKQIEDNTETIASIKSVALALSRRLLTVLVAGHRWGGMSNSQKIADELISYLREIGATDDELDETLTEYHQYKIWDHAQHIEYACGDNAEGVKALTEAKDYGRLYVPSPERYRQILTQHKLLDPVSEAAVDDLEYYLKNRRLRRPEAFLKSRKVQKAS